MARGNDPEGWKYTVDVLPDGRTELSFSNGGKFIYPPLPGGDWAERKARELSEINYKIMRRLAAERAAAGENIPLS